MLNSNDITMTLRVNRSPYSGIKWMHLKAIFLKWRHILNPYITLLQSAGKFITTVFWDSKGNLLFEYTKKINHCAQYSGKKF